MLSPPHCAYAPRFAQAKWRIARWVGKAQTSKHAKGIMNFVRLSKEVAHAHNLCWESGCRALRPHTQAYEKPRNHPATLERRHPLRDPTTIEKRHPLRDSNPQTSDWKSDALSINQGGRKGKAHPRWHTAPAQQPVSPQPSRTSPQLTSQAPL